MFERTDTREHAVSGTSSRILREWPLALVFAFIVGMLWPTLAADFAMIDDHEIETFLGRDQRVTISQVPPLMGRFVIEHNGRFRPAYYAGRILETVVAGSNPHIWHAVRILLALIAAAALYRLLRVLLTPLSAGAVTLLLFSRAINEIWIMLGPGEAYGVPLTLMGLAWVAVHLARRDSRATRLLPGYVLIWLAGFMKESFIPLLPATLLVVHGLLPFATVTDPACRPRLKRSDVVVLLLVVVGIGAQFFLMLELLQTYGHQYRAHFSIDSVRQAFWMMVIVPARQTLWFVPVIAALLTVEHRDRIRLMVLLTAGAVLILLPQWVVYGNLDRAMPGRYLTPGNLFFVLATALGLYFLSRLVANRRALVLRAGVIGILLAAGLFNGLRTHQLATAEVAVNRAFQETLTALVDVKSRHPELPLLYCSTSVFDREPLFSVAQFMSVKLSPRERPFLETFDWQSGAKSPLEKRLAELLTQQSIEGDRAFARIADFPRSDGHCIGVVFSGADAICRCDHTVRVRER